MDGSFMTVVEQQHYSELFSKSDVENSGKVATSHVRSLFLSSQLPMETLQKVRDVYSFISKFDIKLVNYL